MNGNTAYDNGTSLSLGTFVLQLQWPVSIPFSHLF